MRNYLLLVLISLPCLLVFGQQKPITYYLPDVSYNADIPTPQSILGYQVGDWHVTHDQLVYYMRALAQASDRVQIQEYARSYEQRPLVMLTITSTKNHQNIDQIKKDHVAISNPALSTKINIDKQPVVVYQGYSVHGNEASGANAALLTAYYLAAANDSYVDSLLNEAVILLDPCFNPDGLQRFSNWVNMHKSYDLSTDPANREFNEVWPGGRTNHYWFDLNRDWLPVQHPESQGRIRLFHEWKPNILTDHHEMGSQSSFFFQPGIPSRTNPITPARNQELTGMIAEFHAKALDQIGSFYYSKESFDDYYYGKGSTYPDVNACIGILFEQASARGHLQRTAEGDLSFSFAVRNQVKTSLSTQRAALNLRKELLKFQKDFYQNAKQEAKKDPIKGYIIGDQKDPVRVGHLVDILEQHHIQVHSIKKDIKAGGTLFKKDNAYIVPCNQTQYRLIKAMFNTPTTFKDSIFYDVSAWTLPLAFGLDYASLNADQIGKHSSAPQKRKAMQGQVIGGKSPYAYVFRWDAYNAPRVLNALAQKGLTVKVATKPFTASTMAGAVPFTYGSILVPVHQQAASMEAIQQLVAELAEEEGVTFHAIKSGLSGGGVDLGSNSFRKVKAPKVAMIVGRGVTSYDAGEIWHLMDQRYHFPLTLVDFEQMGRINLSEYTALVMVNGSYGKLTKSQTQKIKDWIRQGGTLIPIRSAIRWASSQGLANVKIKSGNSQKYGSGRRAYQHASNDRGAQVTGGAIVEASADLTHPLLYGYSKNKLALFRKGNTFMEPTKNIYATPLAYTRTPLLSGYMTSTNQRSLSGAAALTVSSLGRGRIVCFADNPTFRAFWYGTNKLLANAILFGNITDSRTTESVSGSKGEEEEEDGHHHH